MAGIKPVVPNIYSFSQWLNPLTFYDSKTIFRTPEDLTPEVYNNIVSYYGTHCHRLINQAIYKHEHYSNSFDNFTQLMRRIEKRAY